MSLVELKIYLQANKATSLSAIVNYFNMEPELARMMLSHWERKGRVQRQATIANCGSQCQKCSSLLTEIYAWVGG
jgi:hypothetical protein